MSKKYNVRKFTRELQAAGIPVVSVSEDGTIELDKTATAAQLAQVEQLKTSHDAADNERKRCDEVDGKKAICAIYEILKAQGVKHPWINEMDALYTKYPK